jgi:sugar/nucleoside kinase (ribokinase family)
MISAIGEDEFGEKIIKYLNDNKINTENIQIKKEYVRKFIIYPSVYGFNFICILI